MALISERGNRSKTCPLRPPEDSVDDLALNQSTEKGNVLRGVQQVHVTVAGDFLDEGDETLTVTLSAPFNADLGASIATGTITNDDAGPKLAVTDAVATEGNSGTTALTFTVTTTPISLSNITVDYATSDGTATGWAARVFKR